MSDALSRFISNLQSLDPTNLNAPANQAAMQKFQSLPNNEQRDVLNGLAGKYGATFDELDALSPGDKQRVTENVRAGREAFDGVLRQQQQTTQAQTAQQQAEQPSERPQSFEQAWVAAKDDTPKGNPNEAYLRGHAEYAVRHGEQQASNRHGYQNPARQKQLDRVNAIRNDAERAGVSFGDMADRYVAEGK